LGGTSLRIYNKKYKQHGRKEYAIKISKI